MRTLTPLAIVLLAAASPAAAQEPGTTLPAVEARAMHYLVDCDDRVLPSQREIGEWTGHHNFGQVYAARQRLMVTVSRACQRSGIEQVGLVLERRPPAAGAPMQAIARIERAQR